MQNPGVIGGYIRGEAILIILWLRARSHLDNLPDKFWESELRQEPFLLQYIFGIKIWRFVSVHQINQLAVPFILEFLACFLFKPQRAKSLFCSERTSSLVLFVAERESPEFLFPFQIFRVPRGVFFLGCAIALDLERTRTGARPAWR